MPKISELPPDSALDGAEIVPLTGGGSTASTTVSAIASYAVASDATLAALAAANWAANTIPVGSGADTVSQLAIAASTFPARSSAGNVAAKPLTDFALTLLDDADATTARTTLGAQASDATLTALAAYNTAGFLTQTAADTFVGRSLAAPAAGFTITNPAGTAGNPTFVLANDLAAVEGLSTSGSAHRIGADSWAVRTLTGTANRVTVTNGDGVAGNPTINIPTTLIDSGTYTPTGTNVANIAAITPQVAQYMRVGNTVTVSGIVNVTPTAAGNCTGRLTLPVASALASNFQLAGTCGSLEAAVNAGVVYADAAGDRAEFYFTATTTALRAVPYTYTYVVI